MGRSLKGMRISFRTECLFSECTRGHGGARGISQVYVLDWAWIFRWRGKVETKGGMASLYAFPRWYVPSFLSWCLLTCVILILQSVYTPPVLFLHMPVGLRIERLPFLLFLLTNLQLHMPVDLGIERQCLSCYSIVHYAGSLVWRLRYIGRRAE